MLKIVGIMLLGVFTGYLLKNYQLRWVQKWIMLAIWLLLFLLGIAVGTNGEIMNNLDTIGLKGLILALGGVSGSVILARWDVLPQELLQQDFSMYVLYGLMFLVGISIGSDRKAWAALKGQQLRIVLVPLATIVGTLAGSIGVSFLLTDIRLTDCLAIGSGFGYYSLSSIFITEYRGAELGTIALTTNIIREIITLLGAAVLVRCFGKLAPICSGGATTMDTTLPVITRFSGKEYVIIAIFHGFVVDFSVPFLVTFFAKL